MIRAQLDAARHDLLDLGLRNPLLNYRTTKARGLDVVDEVPAEVHRILVEQGRPMSFLAAPDLDNAPTDLFDVGEFEAGEYTGDLALLLAQPEDDETDSRASRHTDTRLQTPYTSAKLQSRLLSTFYAARTFIDEQGVNVLYLALGMLEWYQDASSDNKRRAPLLLVPVELTRTDVRARFRLRHTGDDIGGNLSLQAKLKADFGLQIPLPDPEADLDIDAYFSAVADVVDEMPRWRIVTEAVHLGFFLFGKLLMYNDLDVEVWPSDASPLDHEIIGALLGDGFAPAEGRLSEADHLDEHLHPSEVHQVVDADSSQTLALLDVKAGHHLILQGPPGTGKSQTITNVIAEAVGAGKSVLFVAEKMAALEVVKRRLDGVHLGEACLELHSHRTNKKDLLAELQRTLALGEPRSTALQTDLEVLVDTRDRLNAYAEAVNTPVGETGVTPYRAYGRLLLQSDRWAGVEPPADIDRSMESWTRPDHARRRARVADMQALVAKIGRPVDHPFWGSARRAFLPTEQAQIESTARTAREKTADLRDKAGRLGDALGLPANSPSDANVLVRAARRALSAPNLRGVRVDADEWHARRSDLAVLIQTGEAYATVHDEHDDVLIPDAWDADVLVVRQHLAAHGEKWYRWFIGDWRSAKSSLAGLMQEPLPKEHNDRLAIVDAILKAQRLQKDLDRFSSLGAGLFGLQWQGDRSDWTVLRRIAEWMAALHADVAGGDVPRGLVAFLAGGPDLDALEPPLADVESSLQGYDSALDAAVGEIDFDEDRHYGPGTLLDELAYAQLDSLITGWIENAPRLQEIVSYNHQADALFDDDLTLFVGLAAEWGHAATHLVDAFDYVWYSTLLDTAFVERPAIARFDGALHDEALRRFADRDRIALEFNQARLALAHWKDMPRHGANGAASGQLGTLRHEFSKKTRHKPIRRLMTEAGRAIQAIKPVFMMSPMSVAAYLPPGSVEFDLVVFDEASQVKPVDAFGALLRGRQAVVVGDSKQLPPTSFFDSVVGDGDEDEASDTRDVESVLELFKARQAPERMLGWHYRSRHESLIAVSNREFYDNKLVVFPSPDAERADVGLVHHPLPEARYDRGGSRANRAEARAVAEAVMAHARATPDRSLMVATFSQAQQKEVRDQVELLRKLDPSLEPFFSDDALEPFEVKNLENVQGDERDVVFISVGYGRDKSGAVSMNFGPLNRDGGERRLNVLVTRARRRCEVFTNLRADDIDLNRTNARGVAAFKRYLQYAETGVLEMNEPKGRESDSPFEDAVAGALRDAGYRVVHQVGVGGFRVDLAVVAPERPGRYLLGVECDGATYHSARTARDRDRIRQSVLEGLGWRIHRIWSTDWFRNPVQELKQAVAAIERAKADPAPYREPRASSESVQIVRGDVPAPEAASVRAEPYVVAQVGGFSLPLHEVPWTRLADTIAQVVRVESPVHVDEAARRIMDASGVKRLGSRIREAMDRAVSTATRHGDVKQLGDFLYLPSRDHADIIPRDRSALPNGSRSFDYIAPEEVQAAIREVISSSFGIAAENLSLEVCRMLGFGQTSEAMRTVIEGALYDLQSAGVVRQQGGMLHLTSVDASGR